MKSRRVLAAVLGENEDDDDSSAYYATRLYRVQKPVQVYAYGHTKPSNEYYGRSQIHRARAYKLLLNPGDALIYASSLFAMPAGGKLLKISLSAPKSSSFEKSYGSYTDLALKQLHKSGHIVPTDEPLPQPFREQPYDAKPDERESYEGENEWPAFTR